jgi:hypothetical protein
MAAIAKLSAALLLSARVTQIAPDMANSAAAM